MKKDKNTLYNRQPEENTAFRAGNMFPGDLASPVLWAAVAACAGGAMLILFVSAKRREEKSHGSLPEGNPNDSISIKGTGDQTQSNAAAVAPKLQLPQCLPTLWIRPSRSLHRMLSPGCPPPRSTEKTPKITKRI